MIFIFGDTVIKTTNFFLDNINLGTFFIATLTFIITFANFYRNRASIKIIQFSDSLAAIIKPDFIDQKTPDVYWHNEYRLIIDVTITNRSAKPITIIEFNLNDEMRFNSYHLAGKLYTVTIQPESSTHNGITAVGNSEVLNFPIENLWLQPMIDIPSHTSIRGHLFFHFPNEDMVRIGRNKLKIVTSRKKFIKYLYLTEIQKSALPLPDSIYGARTRTIDKPFS